MILAEYHQGRSWGGGCAPVPPHIACLMMAALKVLRAARPFGYRADHYADAINYIKFAQALAPKGRRS